MAEEKMIENLKEIISYLEPKLKEKNKKTVYEKIFENVKECIRDKVTGFIKDKALEILVQCLIDAGVIEKDFDIQKEIVTKLNSIENSLNNFYEKCAYRYKQLNLKLNDIQNGVDKISLEQLKEKLEGFKSKYIEKFEDENRNYDDREIRIFCFFLDKKKGEFRDIDVPNQKSTVLVEGQLIEKVVLEMKNMEGKLKNNEDKKNYFFSKIFENIRKK